ncbi:hypothetical protein ACOTJC_29070 [Achromobacter xylosoxidans]|uniref:hypothetical protein n=1 Tax=Alcaligenes xylosoxydans xylosoxydans TaxID=85698 RepID=UPI002E176E2E|nr:hypothetical protein [Achromobacter xylosoxidans]
MKPSDNEIEMLAAGFSIQHKNGLIRFAHALLDKYAPQASAENDWKPAIRKFMDTAIPALAAIANVHTPDEIDALDAIPREPVIDQVRRLSHACEELSRQVRPERPKADKDGGQQRDGDVDERAAFEAWAYRAGMGPKFRESMFAAWEARAALSAPQAEQGERD